MQIIDINIDISFAINALESGQVIAFPTETVFGIGADIFNPQACAEIYSVKSRDRGKPLSAHVSSLEMAVSLLDNPSELFYTLAERFLPGPLAIIASKNSMVSDSITSGMKTISIRYPSDATCLKLISAFGRPIAATSANISGEKSLNTSEEVFRKFNGKFGVVVAGHSNYGLESTIISIVDKPKILRLGTVPKEEIEECIHIKL